MRKNWIISIVVTLVVLGGVVWTISDNRYNSNTSKLENQKSDQDTKDENTNKKSNSSNENSEQSESEDNSSSKVENTIDSTVQIESPKENSLQVDKINGLDLSSKDKVEGIKLPYKVEDKGLEIKSIGKYSGYFVEDGSNSNIDNVVCMVITNTSERDLQYGEIIIKVNGKEAIFKLTNIPSKTSVLVQESTGKIEYKSNYKYEYVSSIIASVDNLPMNSEKVKVTKVNDSITIENISGKNLGTVYVYYKYIQEGGVYLGGITYRTKFENVKKGQTLTQKTIHYSKNASQIVMVDTEK